MIGLAGFLKAVAMLALLVLVHGRAHGADAEQSGTRAVDSGDMRVIQSYSREATDDWLQDNFGLGLSDFELVWDPSSLSFEKRSTLNRRARSAQARAAAAPAPKKAKGNTAPAQAQPGQRSLSLRLQQADDLRRLSNGMRDLPFGLEVKGELPLLARLSSLETRILVPFSWRDEWSAQASLPLRLPGPKQASLWKDLGFSRRLSLRSDYSNRLGLGQMNAGLGTDWAPGGIGTWNLDYDYRVKYGQGDNEAIHWLKLSKEF